jgi:hypothetical protein
MLAAAIMEESHEEASWWKLSSERQIIDLYWHSARGVG